ncbi:LutB/LldF family L-lactate oxidation iron-sulfur protein [Campylobacter helveticus]|uniref:LutB/LldF family L-lactate oxidation iron-sulfur protein n=1 Tax=Campylobacter helveticus TaxID=28898 RepID=UPI0009C3AE84|nr:LutB/LldF family L-lactate oxidation iron-sulfur protein [Campylobacter helveticus]ARE80848.1 NAD-independent L-lactate dehydrogenase LldEFG, iron-sulfur cluster subunit [Campylobacter helveticus]MCR2054698.1 LutB/LldF family L-lactate oxidation iron-sulfur protein [Campylobacter helveticus]TNB59570.1 iron-sulfur cluster-binding protein [Campylobacter helveticus]TNH35413.1 iron-sulfur cluster-binding protein [Campylobacter helveticus]TXK49488.1 iron-sulfur cluster-binding protein [Campyloba
MKAHEEIVNLKLNDTQMRENLNNAMHTLQKNRLKVIDDKFKDWQGLRAKAKQAKNNALMSLEERLVEFEKNATKNGIKVHWASSDEDACEIIYEIMKENNISKILKGKSMASEEIGLNHYLEKKGLKAIETDLGEVIIQLDNEVPVHIVAPAIHKNRYEIGKTFQEKLGAELESEPEKLNAIARKYLRDEFEGLKLGLSGVNFAMSREGAFWLIENEGNGRMCTTAPDIHIALCGIEKVMESFEDAATMVHLLTPSATGQFIPTYNNIITAPRKNGDLDGPKEVHIVLFDHHRSDMLAHKDYYEALRCIRCGACMNFCPVYDKIGGHSYQTTYPGPIGEVISPNLFGMDKTGDILSFCSLCGRCSEVCPVKIPLADLIRKLRCDKVGQGENPPLGASNAPYSKMESFAFSTFANLATNGNKWRFSLSKGHYFNWAVQNFKGVLPVIKKWSAFKELPQIKKDLYQEVQNIEGVIYE